MHTLANSEDPDEMPHNAAFYQDLHCLLRQTQSSEKELQFYLGTHHLRLLHIYNDDDDELEFNDASTLLGH